MDFELGAHIEALHDEAAAFLAEQVTEELEEHLYRTGSSFDEGFTAAMRERGWLAAGWSDDETDGQDPLEYLALRQELHLVDAPTYANGTTILVSKALLRMGTDEQRAEIIPKALRGEVIIALGYTEPEAGSDVANAQIRAVRDGDEWVINGSKMFTTNAHIADYVFLLTRTNTEVAKHKGLTLFLVPMDQPGVEVQAVFTLSGERTNITYYNDVRVDDRWRVGDVDGGWRVMMASLQDEHSFGFGSRITRLLRAAEAWAADATDADGTPRLEDPDVRERFARAATEAEVSRLLELRASWMAQVGRTPEAEGPMAKLFSSEALVRSSQDLAEVLGPDGLRSYFEPTAPENGRVEHMVRFALGTTTYAGTSEIQRNIIAARGLGLPR
jgi:alkylation response protein AidB-like acyl-CoA dehydrogenase